ncbi:MAG: RagB/SusD family nutrient uptake outer membrane protein [Pseudopedobacter saltans]|uniref:RagB/SusD family nutrient uptake outer membrane protein n=1 Tax=Pseudopedobacter saltans TaxID=151895 RepID=A0A2W5GVI0_9SPHI|nr:MAG: RagB/SusD family nutrient uptake outer membrane protein [Pseudopedobacter saltans]
MKKNKLLVITIAASVFMASCNKYLDVNPDNRMDINTVQKVGQLVASAYPVYNYYAFTEAASDNSEDKGLSVGSSNMLLSMYYAWEDYPDGGLNSSDNYWNGCYEAIAVANHALEAIDQSDFGPDVLPYKGEALVARAYAHHMLTMFFAKRYVNGGDNSSPGIPYLTKPEKTLMPKYSRGTVQADYDSIEQDLEAGMKLLNANSSDHPKFHFTPSSAHAFAARFYLFKGEWQKVIDNVGQIVPTTNFTSYLRPINSTWLLLVSIALPLDFANQARNCNLLVANTQSSYYSIYLQPRFGFGPRLSGLYEVNVTGKRVRNYISQYTPGNFCTYKWLQIGSNAGLQSVLFTVDEALLNRAEAYAHLGQYDLALNDLNTFYSVRLSPYSAATDAVTLDKIKAFFGISDPQEGVLTAILTAKKTEFMSEGIRWMDIVRTGMTVNKNLFDADGNESTITLGPDDPRRQFQLPVSTLTAGLEPNPR